MLKNKQTVWELLDDTDHPKWGEVHTMFVDNLFAFSEPPEHLI